MKICVIGLPRCGTTALYFFISEHLNKNYICKNEPWNTKRNVELYNNCFYKLVINDTVECQLNENESIFNFTYDLINKFDRVIFLKRKEREGMVNSLSHQLIYRYKNPQYRQKFADEYYDKWIPIFDEITKDKKVYYYEDLYTDNINKDIIEICNYIGVDLDKEIWKKHMDKNNRKPYNNQTKYNLI